MSVATSTANPPKEDDVVFTAYITLKNGKRLYAWMYGLKAFALRIRKKK